VGRKADAIRVRYLRRKAAAIRVRYLIRKAAPIRVKYLIRKADAIRVRYLIRKAAPFRVRYLRRKAAPILRQRAVYGGWIYLLNSAVKQIYCVVGLCSLGHMVVISPVAGPNLTRAILEPNSCSISVTGNE